MSFVDSLRALTSSDAEVVVPEARVWDCSNPSQIFNAAFEVHEAAMKAGFMPDEATTLSLSLAELGTQAVLHGTGGQARVQFENTGWKLEVSDSSAQAGRLFKPLLRASLPTPLTSLQVRSERGASIVVAHYERHEHA